MINRIDEELFIYIVRDLLFILFYQLKYQNIYIIIFNKLRYKISFNILHTMIIFINSWLLFPKFLYYLINMNFDCINWCLYTLLYKINL